MKNILPVICVVAGLAMGGYGGYWMGVGKTLERLNSSQMTLWTALSEKAEGHRKG